MRLDHLLSKEELVKGCFVIQLPSEKLDRLKFDQLNLITKISGVDALGGHTRSHPEHDG